MYAVARSSGKKTWQTRRERVSVEAALAIQRENVKNRLTRLREEIGHPEKAGEPLPQDQAAARAGVTARQWQRWESGESVPYARNLSAVADAFEFDVGEFYDGPAGQRLAHTPDLSLVKPPAESALSEALAEFTSAIAKQNQLLQRQSEILERIEAKLGQDTEAADRIEAASGSLDAVVQKAIQGLTASTPRTQRAASKNAKTRSPRAST